RVHHDVGSVLADIELALRIRSALRVEAEAGVDVARVTGPAAAVVVARRGAQRAAHTVEHRIEHGTGRGRPQVREPEPADVGVLRAAAALAALIVGRVRVHSSPHIEPEYRTAPRAEREICSLQS